MKIPSPFQNPLSHQFNGFLKTPALWEKNEYFALPQYQISEVSLPAELEEELIIPEKLVLGKRVEYFFFYYIQNFSRERILASNYQIKSDKRTIGELDFLLEDMNSQELTHVELVYKFYLYDPSLEKEEDRWIGPNRNDSLKRKLKKLKDQQLPLLFAEETQPLLESLDCTPEMISQKVCFKANLFVPLPMRQEVFPYINSKCIQGYWIRAEEFTEELYGEYQFYTPSKKDWPIEPENGLQWYSYSDIREQISRLLDSQKSPLVWMRSKKEHFRFFVVWW